jgi:carbamoyltransferase
MTDPQATPLSALGRRTHSHGRFRAEVQASAFRPPHPAPHHRFAGPARPAQAPRVVLGVSAYYHDACAALVVDGQVVAAVQEDRFSRKNHDAGFPAQAIAFCLQQAGLRLADVELVAFYEEPFLKADRLAQTARAAGAMSAATATDVARGVRRNVLLQEELRSALGEYAGPLCFVEHHVSHAASAFYASPFERAAGLVVDGVGEWATTTLLRAGPQGIELLEQVDYPHSLGLFYSAITAYLGFKINSDEYKVMALGAFSAPAYEAEVARLLRLHGDGSFSLDLERFSHHRDRKQAFHPALAELFGLPARAPGAALEHAHHGVAWAAQRRLEEAMQGLLRRLWARTEEPALVMAGGVALNSVANHVAFEATPFESLFVQPAATDAGGALGAALYAWHHVPEVRTRAPIPAPRFDPYLGPEYGPEVIEACLEEEGAEHRRCEGWPELYAAVAALLAEGKVVGWYQGRMEVGPRALGARSILATPCRAEMQTLVNEKIKFREGFRPFAPAVLADRAGELFELGKPACPLDYMLFVVPVRPEARDRIPAVVHADGTARPQRVYADTSPHFFGLIEAFDRLTGVPAVLNTSFNLAGEPIVCTPQDAFRTFMYSEMDALVMERFIVTKEAP